MRAHTHTHTKAHPGTHIEWRAEYLLAVSVCGSELREAGQHKIIIHKHEITKSLRISTTKLFHFGNEPFPIFLALTPELPALQIGIPLAPW